MAAIDDIARPDTELQGDKATSNQQKFLDIWWRVCSRTGLTKLTAVITEAVLGHQVPQYGPDWAPTKTVTWLGREVAALPQNFANTQTVAEAAKASADAALAEATALRADVANLQANLAANVTNAVTAHFAANPVPGVDPNTIAEAVFQRFKAQTEK